MAPTGFVPLLILGVFAWRVIVRLRRNIGKQKLQRKRLAARIAIYAVMCVFLGILAGARPKVLGGLAGGMALGLPLALLGWRLTRFETTAEGHFYIPNPVFGIAISLLFIGRLVYRLLVVYSAVERTGHVAPELQSPLTHFLFGLLAGYYIAYYGTILRRWNGEEAALAPAFPKTAIEKPVV